MLMVDFVLAKFVEGLALRLGCYARDRLLLK